MNKMWFKKILINIFKINYHCDKCNLPVKGIILCKKCEKYLEIIKQKKQGEIKVIEENKRKNWIKQRDKFLEEQDGRR